MNLFDVLSAGKRSLNEESVSSLLAWLLDPGQSHGCGPLFLRRLLNEVDKNAFSYWADQLSHTIAYRKASDISITVLMEYPVASTSAKRRDVDITIILENTLRTQVIAIENKIRKDSHDKMQLVDEYNGLTTEYPNAEIGFLYLTPSRSPKFAEAFDLLPDNIIKQHMIWASESTTTTESSFVEILRKILQDDDTARINPLSQEIRFVLRSFIVFAENDFQAVQASTSHLSPGQTSRYFRDVVAGLDGIRELLKLSGLIFVGFDGGKRALQRTPKDHLLIA